MSLSISWRFEMESKDGPLDIENAIVDKLGKMI